jgi:hypothetical protein
VTTPPTDKTCPQCAARNAAEALSCGCGYLFSAAAAPDSAGLVAQAEALYEYYLSTRLARAVKAAKAARMELLRDPQSAAKINALAQSEDEVRLLQAQLALQAARAAQAQHSTRAAEAPATHDGSGSPAPSAAFSNRQAARAETITDGARTSETPPPANAPTAAFALAQSQRAERVAREQQPARSVEPSPRPFISDEEIAALRQPGATIGNKG